MLASLKERVAACEAEKKRIKALLSEAVDDLDDAELEFFQADRRAHTRECVKSLLEKYGPNHKFDEARLELKDARASFCTFFYNDGPVHITSHWKRQRWYEWDGPVHSVEYWNGMTCMYRLVDGVCEVGRKAVILKPRPEPARTKTGKVKKLRGAFGKKRRHAKNPVMHDD